MGVGVVKPNVDEKGLLLVTFHKAHSVVDNKLAGTRP